MSWIPVSKFKNVLKMFNFDQSFFEVEKLHMSKERIDNKFTEKYIEN